MKVTIVLGNGIKLFKGLGSPIGLVKESQKSYESGLVQIEYTIKNT